MTGPPPFLLRRAFANNSTAVWIIRIAFFLAFLSFRLFGQVITSPAGREIMNTTNWGNTNQVLTSGGTNNATGFQPLSALGAVVNNGSVTNLSIYGLLNPYSATLNYVWTCTNTSGAATWKPIAALNIGTNTPINGLSNTVTIATSTNSGSATQLSLTTNGNTLGIVLTWNNTLVTAAVTNGLAGTNSLALTNTALSNMVITLGAASSNLTISAGTALSNLVTSSGTATTNYVNTVATNATNNTLTVVGTNNTSLLSTIATSAASGTNYASNLVASAVANTNLTLVNFVLSGTSQTSITTNTWAVNNGGALSVEADILFSTINGIAGHWKQVVDYTSIAIGTNVGVVLYGSNTIMQPVSNPGFGIYWITNTGGQLSLSVSGLSGKTVKGMARLTSIQTPSN
jgi:hypothetical protein